MCERRRNPFALVVAVIAVVAVLCVAPPATRAQGQARVITRTMDGHEKPGPWVDIGTARAIANGLAANPTGTLSVWIQPKRQWYQFWLGFVPAPREPFVVAYRAKDVSADTHAPKKMVQKR